MLKREFDAVFVDWNGTLLDDLFVAYASVINCFDYFSLPSPTFDEFRENISTNFMDFYSQFGIPRDCCSVVQSLRKEFIRDHWGDVRLHEGVMQFLHLCHDYSFPVFLVSGEQSGILYDRMRQFSCGHMFREFIGDLWFKKDCFRSIMGRYGFSPERCLFVDDSRLGLSEASSVGIQPVAFLSGYGQVPDILHLGMFGMWSFTPLSRLFFGVGGRER